MQSNILKFTHLAKLSKIFSFKEAVSRNFLIYSYSNTAPFKNLTSEIFLILKHYFKMYIE